MLELYENIKKLRKQNGWSQEELAKKAGYTDRSSIAKIEKGQFDLPQSKIYLFAEIFGVTPSELMGNDGIAGEQYYLNDDARDYAQFLFENPEYRVLFDASRKVKKEDLQIVRELLDRFS